MKKIFKKINELSDFHSLETDFAIKLKPWLLGFIFSSPRPMNPFSQDNLLKVTASNYGLASKGLEAVEEHYAVLDSLSSQDQFQILKNVLISSDFVFSSLIKHSISFFALRKELMM